MPKCSEHISRAACSGINKVCCFLFNCVQVDRNWRENKKNTQGEVSVYMNNRWCVFGHVTVEDQVCCPDVRMLATFASIISAQRVFLRCHHHHHPTHRWFLRGRWHCQRCNCKTFKLITISGTFNYIAWKPTLPTFKRHLLYANLEEACSSIVPAPHKEP